MSTSSVAPPSSARRRSYAAGAAARGGPATATAGPSSLQSTAGYPVRGVSNWGGTLAHAQGTGPGTPLAVCSPSSSTTSAASQTTVAPLSQAVLYPRLPALLDLSGSEGRDRPTRMANVGTPTLEALPVLEMAAPSRVALRGFSATMPLHAHHCHSAPLQQGHQLMMSMLEPTDASELPAHPATVSESVGERSFGHHPVVQLQQQQQRQQQQQQQQPGQHTRREGPPASNVSGNRSSSISPAGLHATLGMRGDSGRAKAASLAPRAPQGTSTQGDHDFHLRRARLAQFRASIARDVHQSAGTTAATAAVTTAAARASGPDAVVPTPPARRPSQPPPAIRWRRGLNPERIRRRAGIPSRSPPPPVVPLSSDTSNALRAEPRDPQRRSPSPQAPLDSLDDSEVQALEVEVLGVRLDV